jgi:diaminohydroxyphosphoribosylaminopyrimidine deaminase/5-amino-6-(5-phosphoribosylamino)uracil reductase
LDSKLVRTAKRQRTLIVVSSRAPDSRLARLRKAGVRILRSNPRRLPALFRALAALGLHRILVEGGATVHASMIAAGLADEVCVYVAPKIVGARPRMSQARRLREPELLKFGSDVMIWGRL